MFNYYKIQNIKNYDGTVIILQKFKINEVAQFIWDSPTEITPDQNPEFATKLLFNCSPT
jgi:hypothetical protein